MRLFVLFAVASALHAVDETRAAEPASLNERLAVSKFKLVYESYAQNNWELFVSRADGTQQVNLTNSPDRNELYPQASPDGRRICYISDEGQGRNTVRSVWVMDIDGKNRAKVSDHARQPCWGPDSKTIVYLPQEYKKFNIADYFTKGLMYYDVVSRKSRPHPNSGELHHLYNPSFSANGKWIVSTVHAGMGYKHAIILIEAEGSRIIDLKIRGCRPCLGSAGRTICWGRDDHTIVVAELDVSAETPKVGTRRFHVQDKSNKIYHSDLSPDGKYLSLSRGPNGKGDLSKPGTHEAACEMVGVYAKKWNVLVIPIADGTSFDLGKAAPGALKFITSSGESNKEPDWFIAD